jgi:hypothetical protein
MLGSFLTETRHDQLLRSARAAPDRWIEFDAEAMRRHYNRLPFLVRHRLDAHPAFELAALHSLCRRLPDAQVCRRRGAIPADAHFDSSLATYATPLGVDEAFGRMEADGLYVAVYNPETDPEYRVVIEGLLGEIAQAVAPFERRINWYSTYLFVSAGGSLTPYHMDREMNFLLQIRGEKTACLWDPNDDAVMSPAQRAHLFSSSDDARPVYRPELDALAMRFELQPGLGVHHPFIAPHLVHTGPRVAGHHVPDAAVRPVEPGLPLQRADAALARSAGGPRRALRCRRPGEGVRARRRGRRTRSRAAPADGGRLS